MNRAENRAIAARRKPEDEPQLAPGLYLVATPIGNLEDITLRALRVLRQADVVACEDTRVSGTLLKAYEIAASLLSYHDHNAEEMRPKLLARLRAGQRVALISDAGTPLVSDPGYRLARDCAEQGLPLTVVPGPSAALAGLCLSGLPTDRFTFAGFLPSKAAAREAALRELAGVPCTLIFFESPHRVQAMLASVGKILGDRPAAVAREITKLFEETRRGSVLSLADVYASLPDQKGEMVVIVGPPGEAKPAAVDIDALLMKAMVPGTTKEAVARVSAETGLSRKLVYARALALSRPHDNQD
jgi:16S rRNA (cytidine1402-2'-O)-methyltransferase